MTREELLNLLELINNAEGEKKEQLIREHKEDILIAVFKIKNKQDDIIVKYNCLLYDIGAITSHYLTPEERERRRQAAINGPKYNETEKLILQKFIEIFKEEPYWLKSKKTISKFRNKGVPISLPNQDCNLCDGYLDYRPKGYSICLTKGLPYFYIYIGEDTEDIFLYLQRKEEIDVESIELNQKAIQFLIEIQRAFASRTPDAIYLSSFYNEEEGEFVWMETSSDFDFLLDHTERITSGMSNIVSVSSEAINSLKINKDYILEMIEKRNLTNGNPSTIDMLNKIRISFDDSLAKDKIMKRERINPEHKK